MGTVTDPALLDRLLGLPIGYPYRDLAMWAETSAAAPGIVDRGADGCTVTRLLEPPLVVHDLIVPAPRGWELGAVQDARLFASFTRRWAQAHEAAIPDTAVLKRSSAGWACRPRMVASSCQPSRSVGNSGWMDVAAGREGLPPMAQAGNAQRRR